LLVIFLPNRIRKTKEQNDSNNAQSNPPLFHRLYFRPLRRLYRLFRRSQPKGNDTITNKGFF
jgi:hypothetical protein